jgi:chromosome segregation ATPase
LTLDCQRCGKPTHVPEPGAASKRAELERHLKENESQRTEINGYINQLSIQLHRWQLRLQTLNERNKQLAEEMAGLGDTPAAAAADGR